MKTTGRNLWLTFIKCISSDEDKFNNGSVFWAKGGLSIELGKQSYNTISIMKLKDGSFTQNYYQDGKNIGSRTF